VSNDRKRSQISPKQTELLKRWLDSLLHPDGGTARTQTQLAELLGVSQPLISDVLRGKQIPSMGTVRLMIENGQKRLGPKADFTSLMQTALYCLGPYEARAMIRARGQALDILSAVYDEDFLQAIEAADCPPQGEGWNVEQWIEYIVQCRRLWRGSNPSAAHIRRIGPAIAKKGG